MLRKAAQAAAQPAEDHPPRGSWYRYLSQFIDDPAWATPERLARVEAATYEFPGAHKVIAGHAKLPLSTTIVCLLRLEQEGKVWQKSNGGWRHRDGKKPRKRYGR